MKKPFKNVYLTVEGKVYLRNGNEMKPVAGLYHIAGVNYSSDEIKTLCVEIFAGTNPPKVEKPIMQHETIEVKHDATPSNTKDQIKKVLQHDETRKRTGKENSRFKGSYTINGKEYLSAHDAAKELNLSPSTIIRRCKLNANGYSFQPV